MTRYNGNELRTLDGCKISDVRALKSDNFEKLSHPIGDAVGAHPKLSISRAGPS
jgi:hypothetical protein